MKNLHCIQLCIIYNIYNFIRLFTVWYTSSMHLHVLYSLACSETNNVWVSACGIPPLAMNIVKSVLG